MKSKILKLVNILRSPSLKLQHPPPLSIVLEYKQCGIPATVLGTVRTLPITIVNANFILGIVKFAFVVIKVSTSVSILVVKLRPAAYRRGCAINIQRMVLYKKRFNVERLSHCCCILITFFKYREVFAYLNILTYCLKTYDHSLRVLVVGAITS